MTDDFFRRGQWVTVEDLYDHDRTRLGPFPTVAAAAAWCDAYHGTQVTAREVATVTPTAVGVWNLASCDGYDAEARVEALYRARLRDPDAPRPDEGAIARRHGARWEYEWRADLHRGLGAASCWCGPLRDGRIPVVDSDVLKAYLSLGVDHERDLFVTPQHHGELAVARCRPCGEHLLHLRVEHEGFGDSIHHYFTPVAADVVAALEAGKLDAGSYEAWVGLHAGIYAVGYEARCYTRAIVGYLGIDHRLE